MRQLVKQKEFKPVKLHLEIDLVSYPARAEGLVNLVTCVYTSSGSLWYSLAVVETITTSVRTYDRSDISNFSFGSGSSELYSCNRLVSCYEWRKSVFILFFVNRGIKVFDLITLVSGVRTRPRLYLVCWIGCLRRPIRRMLTGPNISFISAAHESRSITMKWVYATFWLGGKSERYRNQTALRHTHHTHIHTYIHTR